MLAYVQQALVQLYARITKIGWNDKLKTEFMFRTVTADLSKFLQASSQIYRSTNGCNNSPHISTYINSPLFQSGSPVHATIGVQLMTRLVIEMNQMTEV